MPSIKPIGNRILVKISKKSQTTASGIIVSTKEEEQKSRGTIAAMGAGFGEEKELLSELKVGDQVVFGSYSGQEFEDENDMNSSYKILKVTDIVAVVE